MAKKKEFSYRLGASCTAEDKKAFASWYDDGGLIMLDVDFSDTYSLHKKTRNLLCRTAYNGMHTLVQGANTFDGLLKLYAKTFTSKDYLTSKNYNPHTILQGFVNSNAKLFSESDFDAIEDAYKKSLEFDENSHKEPVELNGETYERIDAKDVFIQVLAHSDIENYIGAVALYHDIDLLISCRAILVKYQELKKAIYRLFTVRELYSITNDCIFNLVPARGDVYKVPKCYSEFQAAIADTFITEYLNGSERLDALLGAHKYISALAGNEYEFAAK